MPFDPSSALRILSARFHSSIGFDAYGSSAAQAGLFLNLTPPQTTARTGC
jgi:hypothetical protein